MYPVLFNASPSTHHPPVVLATILSLRKTQIFVRVKLKPKAMAVAMKSAIICEILSFKHS